MANPDIIIAAARQVAGLCACMPWRDQLDRFLGKVANGGHWDLARPFKMWRDEQGKTHTQGVSTCALVTEAIWRLGGVKVPSQWLPYVSGTFVRTHVWPESLGATRSLQVMPNEGDALWTASHFVACLEQWFDPWDPNKDHQDCWTIEGGQICLEDVDGHEGLGLQAIHRRHRRYWPNAGRPMIAEVLSDGSTGPKSYVLGIVDVSRLPEV